MTDALPANVVVAAPPNVAASAGCALAKVAAAAGGSAVTYQTGGTIPAGGCSISVDVTSSTVATHLNTIPAGALRTTGGNSPAAATASLQVLALPGVAKSFSPLTLATGAPATLTLTLGNTNGAAATLTADFVDTLPAGLVVAPAPNVGGTCPSARVVATAGASSISYTNGAPLPTGGCTITVAVTAASAGGYTNSVPAGALQTTQGANPAPATARVDFLDPPTVAKAFDRTIVSPGDHIVLTITLGNTNGIPAMLQTSLVDTLPAGLSVDASPSPSGTCDLSAVTTTPGSITYAAGAAIPPGGCTVVATLTVSGAGTLTNVIAAGSLTTEGGSNATAATAAVSAGFPDIPSLSPMGLALLGLLLAAAAAWALRSQSAG
jgi:uncharacterized repeat protein (TIGR01451 family)